MRTTGLFKSRNSQAVRHSEDFQGNASGVDIFRRGDEVVSRRPPATMEAAFDLLAALPDDFIAEGRNDSAPQPREAL